MFNVFFGVVGGIYVIMINNGKLVDDVFYGIFCVRS